MLRDGGLRDAQPLRQLPHGERLLSEVIEELTPSSVGERVKRQHISHGLYIVGEWARVN